MEAAKAFDDAGDDDSSSPTALERERLLCKAAEVMQRRRSAGVTRAADDEVPGFVRTVHTLLRVCDPGIIGWSDDGAQVLIRDPGRFAAEICPRFFHHRNSSSFTRLLNMYQFHKVPVVVPTATATATPTPPPVCDDAMAFEHPHFHRDRPDLLALVQRKGTQAVRDELVARELLKRSQEQTTAPPSPRMRMRMRSPVQHRVHAALPRAPARRPLGNMSRMADLEAKVEALHRENDHLKRAQAESNDLKRKVDVQRETIDRLTAQSADVPPWPTFFPSSESASASASADHPSAASAVSSSWASAMQLAQLNAMAMFYGNVPQVMVPLPPGALFASSAPFNGATATDAPLATQGFWPFRASRPTVDDDDHPPVKRPRHQSSE